MLCRLKPDNIEEAQINLEQSKEEIKGNSADGLITCIKCDYFFYFIINNEKAYENQA